MSDVVKVLKNVIDIVLQKKNNTIVCIYEFPSLLHYLFHFLNEPLSQRRPHHGEVVVVVKFRRASRVGFVVAVAPTVFG
jgi:hypothetical protein